MLIQLRCECGQSLKAKPESAGKALTCPKCRQPVIVPIPESDPQSESLVDDTEGGLIEHPVPVPRATANHSGRLPMICSISSLVLSVACVAFVIAPRPNPLGKGLSAYDLSTPEKSMRSGLMIQANADILASIQLGKIQNTTADTLATIKIQKQAECKGTVILFTAHNERGIEKKEIHGFEKDAKTGVWVSSYVSEYTIDEPRLKKAVADWTREPSERVSLPPSDKGEVGF